MVKETPTKKTKETPTKKTKETPTKKPSAVKTAKKNKIISFSPRSLFLNGKKRLLSLGCRLLRKSHALVKKITVLIRPLAKHPWVGKSQKKITQYVKKTQKSRAYKYFMAQSISVRFSIAVVVFILLWMFSGLLVPSKQGKNQTAEEVPFQVRVYKSFSSEETVSVAFSGETADSRHVELKSEIIGRVIVLHNEKGAIIEAGDPIIELDAIGLEAEMAQAGAALELRRLEFDSAQNLASQGLRSRTRFIEAEMNFYAAQARMERTRRDFENTIIRAPFSGVLRDIYVERGDFLTAGVPVAVIDDLDPLLVRVSVSETNVENIKFGDKARGELANGVTIDGLVSFVARTGNPQTRTFDVDIEIANRDAELRKGLSAKIRIDIGRVQAHRLPNSVLSLSDQGELGVKAVNKKDVVFFQPITILQNEAENLLVSGLEDGVRIISVGQEFVTVGQKVRVVNQQKETTE